MVSPIASVHQFSHSECTLADAVGIGVEVLAGVEALAADTPQLHVFSTEIQRHLVPKTIVVHLHTYTAISLAPQTYI